MDKPNPYPVASQTSSAAIDTTQHPTGQMLPKNMAMFASVDPELLIVRITLAVAANQCPTNLVVDETLGT